jgi:UDP-glucose 4-epimerase
VLDEEHPCAFFSGAPQWFRDRVEADTAGLSPFPIAVLRLAEVWAPHYGSQIFDYVRSRVCFRPLGYDPMLQLLTLEDAVRAVTLAPKERAEGCSTSRQGYAAPDRVIAKSGRRDIPVPGPLLAPLYGLRTLVVGREFGYGANFGRFHFGAVLDGARAPRELGYVPRHRLEWPAEHRAHLS